MIVSITVPKPGPVSDDNFGELLMNVWLQAMGQPAANIDQVSGQTRAAWAAVAQEARLK